MSQPVSFPPAEDPRRAASVGLIYALMSYLWWGFMPLYFAQVRHIDPWLVVAHRVVWSVAFLVLVIAVQRRGAEVLAALRSRRTLGGLVASALFIAINWLVFIYAISTKQVVQSSLGYYINPLVCVVLGLFVLGERLRALQWVSVALAAVGVTIAATSTGQPPWIALSLAASFGMYGLMRKLVPVGPVVGLFVETLVLLPLAAGLLAWTMPTWGASFTSRDYTLLVSAGVITALPLLWFAAAVRRLKLSTIGFLQYLSPTTQLLVATLLMGEPLNGRKLIGFVWIWVALALFSWDAWRTHRAPATAGVEME